MAQSPPSKEDKVRLHLRLSTAMLPGATVQWLETNHQRDHLLEAITAFWSPFAIRDQHIDPLWAEAQALSSISRLQQQIALIQRSFGIPNLEVTSQMSAPVVNGFSTAPSAPPHVEAAPIPVQAAIPVAAPALPAAIPVVPLVPLSVPQSQPIPLEDDEFDGYGGIHIKGFEDFDAADAANAALDELDD